MNEALNSLTPSKVWHYFKQIIEIPRASGNEGRIAEFLLGFAKRHGFNAHKDLCGNIIIDVPASTGRENSPTVILQGHMDMVPVCDDGFEHDFSKDPIEAYVQDGYVRAAHTTLGADNGIAIAMILALFEDVTLSHGPLRAIFTVEEETTMKGALSLDPKYLDADYLINLDSEDNGMLFVNCAGSTDVNVGFPTQRVVPENCDFITLKFKNFSGGHSGADIHLGRANAIKVLASVLDECAEECDFFIQSIEGGFVRNSIPTFAQCSLAIPFDQKDRFLKLVSKFFAIQKELYATTDSHMESEILPSAPNRVLGYAQGLDLIRLLRSLPSGVIRMSPEFAGIPETSVNLGTVKTFVNKINICLLPRSLSAAALDDLCSVIKAHISLLDNTEIEFSNRHLPWSSPAKNRLIDVIQQSCADICGKPFKITALHAGVECAAFAAKNRKLQLISAGPEILNPHSTKERVNIKGTAEMYSIISRALAAL